MTIFGEKYKIINKYKINVVHTHTTRLRVVDVFRRDDLLTIEMYIYEHAWIMRGWCTEKSTGFGKKEKAYDIYDHFSDR